MQSAQQVIIFCELTSGYKPQGMIEHWNDIPPVSQNYERSRDAIIVHLKQVINNIQSDKRSFL
jgi:hypothetical protein